MDKLIQDNGITRTFMPTYTPAINGKVERTNRTLIEGTRALLLDTNVPLMHIGYAVQYITEWYNLLPQGHNIQSPREILYGKSTISSQMFHPFGCKVNYLSSSNRGGKSKLEPITSEGVYLGFRINTIIGHIIYNPIDNRIIYSTHTYFMDNSLYYTKPLDMKTFSDSTKYTTKLTSAKQVDKISKVKMIHNIERTDNKNTKKPHKGTTAYIPHDPSTKEAINYKEWRDAMIKELTNHENNNTFTIVNRPPKTALIPLKWVYKTKTDKNNNIKAYKARLVAAGNREKKKKDETITAPTSDQALVKIIISIALQYNWHIHQADVTAAYLHANINKEIYMRFPAHANLNMNNYSPETQCLKLNKSLYGLRVSGHNWYNHFAKTLTSIGFHSITTSDTIFIRKRFENIVICLLYVDDCLITGTTELLIAQAIEDIQRAKVKINDMGELEQFLGVNYERTGPHTMKLSRNYTLQNNPKIINAKFETPSYQEYITEDNIANSPYKQFPIRSIVGDVLYTALTTRPDLTYASIYLSHYLDNTNDATWRFTKRLMYYYNKTKSMKLQLTSNDKDEHTFKIYCDSDAASDPISRHSYGGYIVYYNNIPIFWRTKQSKRVCTSSTHSELDASFNAIQSTQWLFQIINDLRTYLKEPPLNTIHLYQDNQSVMALLHKEYFPIKLWDIRYKYLYEKVQYGEITLHYIPTENMIADIFTKPLSNNTFIKHRNTIGIE